MPLSETPTDYRAYLLRIWHEDPAGAWRATLKNVENGEVRHFAALAPLLDFLQRSDSPPDLEIGDYR